MQDNNYAFTYTDYEYIDEFNNPKVNFYIEKIHSRKNYKWIHPVHEVLEYTGNNKEIKK